MIPATLAQLSPADIGVSTPEWIVGGLAACMFAGIYVAMSVRANRKKEDN